MKAMAFYRFCWVGALVGTMLCAGCFGKSQPSRFYTLSAMEQAAAGALPVSPARDVAIGIGPIKIADYLDRSEIVTRTGDNRLELAEYDQWAGSFEDNLTQVMADNIGVMVPTERIYLYPWPTSLTLDYQVVLDIVRCDGRLNGEVLLTARWRVLAGAKTKSPGGQTIHYYRTGESPRLRGPGGRPESGPGNAKPGDRPGDSRG